MGYTELANEMIKRIKEKTAKPCVQFHLKPNQVDVLGNKIGGVPFIPKRGEYPVSTVSGEKLFLLIQLNFEMIPHMENYPTKGILQIFIESEECYGVNFDDPQEQSTWRIIYHEDISSPMSREDVVKIMPKITEDTILPFETPGQEFELECTEREMPISINSFDFDRVLKETCIDLMEEEWKDKGWYSMPNEISDRLNQAFYGEGSRLAGYPAFTQFDPREESFGDYQLLIQIDSESEDKEWYLMWGDIGIANFFIHPDDLKKCDFSNVYYNWDCG